MSRSATGSIDSKKNRGVAKGCKLDKQVKKHGKFKIVFPPGEKYPMKYESDFADGIGIVIRNNAEIQGGIHWRQVPMENKEICYARLFQWFDIEGWSIDERVNTIVDSRLQTAHTRWRSTLHTVYKDLVDKGISPREVCPREDLTMTKWQAACDFIEDEKFQKKSRINSHNRSKMPVNHTSGKTAMLTRYRRMVEKSKVVLWRDTHVTKKNGGQFVNSVAQSMHEKMIAMQSQPVNEDEEPPSEDAILESTLGHRSGYIKGMGHGVEVARGRHSSSNAVANAELKEKLQQLENANDKIVNLTEAYEEQNKTLEEQRLKLDEQMKEMEVYKEQNKTYSQKIDALQVQMESMQQLIQKLIG